MQNMIDRTFSIAPMMDWTDRHCRFFHRQLSQHAYLFTEMTTAQALVHGDVERLIGFDEAEHPVALQIGGSDPKMLAKAAKIGASRGYKEINLNVGCPSDRVQSGAFGACLMAKPSLVAECVAAMQDAVTVPVTVKCRIGIDDQDSEQDLDHFVTVLMPCGLDHLYVHARKAWLEGLSPKQNRHIPPLDYDRVYRLKQDFDIEMSLNGGIVSLEQAQVCLQHMDGVMMGRAAYHTPTLLLDVDRYFFHHLSAVSMDSVIMSMVDYAQVQLARGVRLNQITRHMIGLMHQRPGARRWRQLLTMDACKPDATASIIAKAYDAVLNAEARQAG